MLIENCAQGDKAEVCSTFLYMHVQLYTDTTPLPYPQLVTLFLRHFEIPMDSKPFVLVKSSFSIGVGAVTSFGYRKDVDG